jgi:protein-S-isoprenylcysteine O-methyltransferase Ste14
MASRDLAIYAVHAGFWAAFGVTHLLLRRAPAGGAGAETVRAGVGARAPEAAEAPHSKLLVWFHALAFGVMYFGIGSTVVPGRVPDRFPGQRILGALVIASGSALMCWARAAFESWRFRAKVEAGHGLATGGPFSFIRHPIYAGLDLLAVGSAIWIPTPVMAAAAILMIAGSDLRGRAEENLLERTFGAPYRDLMTRTRRFVPGVY